MRGLMLLAIAACSGDVETTDCAINSTFCEQLCNTVAAEGPSFEYGNRQSFECEGTNLTGDRTMHCANVFAIEGNVGCCTGDFTPGASDVEWYSCPEEKRAAVTDAARVAK